MTDLLSALRLVFIEDCCGASQMATGPHLQSHSPLLPTPSLMEGEHRNIHFSSFLNI